VGDPAEAVRPIEPAAGEQTHPTALAPDDHPIAVVLDFMNPLRPFRRLRPACGQAGLDETRGVLPRGGYAPQHCAGTDSRGRDRSRVRTHLHSGTPRIVQHWLRRYMPVVLQCSKGEKATSSNTHKLG
jgi:hypothetical protein